MEENNQRGINGDGKSRPYNKTWCRGKNGGNIQRYYWLKGKGQGCVKTRMIRVKSSILRVFVSIYSGTSRQRGFKFKVGEYCARIDKCQLY